MILTERKKGVLADLIRALAERGQHGHRLPPRYLILLPDYCTFYWDWRWPVLNFMRGRGMLQGVPRDQEEKVAFNLYLRATRLLERYQRLVNYITEVKPGWQVVAIEHPADNSVWAVERSVDGRTRKRMLCGPGGDACF